MVEFTEQEYLLLSGLAYTNKIKNKYSDRFDRNGNPVNNSESVYIDSSWFDSSTNNKSYKDADFDKDPYEAAVRNLKKKIENNHFKITKSINNNTALESGFAAFAIEPEPNPDNQVFVLCRGSDSFNLNNLNDWFGADAGLANGITVQQREMEEFMKGLEGYDHINITGHSLGGNLAMYAGITFSAQDKIDGIYSYDGPGFQKQFLDEHINQVNKINKKIHNYQNEYDPVSSLLYPVGEVIIVESTQDNNIKYSEMIAEGISKPVTKKVKSYLRGHERWDMKFDSNGRLKRNSSQTKSQELITLQSLSQKDIAIAIGFLSMLYNDYREALLWADRYLHFKIRDFSTKMRETIMNAAKEVDDEKWWDIEKWDCWYRLQNKFGLKNYDLLCGNINSYYRKLIDVNNGSYEKMKNIFDKVYSIDKSAEKSINGYNQNLNAVLNALKELNDGFQ